MKKLGIFAAFILILIMAGTWAKSNDVTVLNPFKTSVEKNAETKTPVRSVRRKVSYLGRIRAARELMTHDYYSEATAELVNAIKEKPEFIEPYLLLGEIHLRTKSDDKLNALLAELANRFPGNEEVLTLAIRQSINEQKYGETLEAMAQLDPIPARLEMYQAILLALQNNHTQAREILERLQRVDVKSKDFIVTNYGIVEAESDIVEDFIRVEESQKIRDVLVVYEEFDELAESKNAHLFAEISQALAQNDEAFLAREFADVAIKEDVTYIDAWILRGYSNLLIENYSGALEDLRYAYELDPIRPEVHYFLALALYESSKYDEAALFFEKALEYDFQFSEEVRWKLLEIFARQKKYDQVIELYQQLLNYDTEPEKFTSAVHTAVDLLGQPEVALEFTQILIDKDPNNVFSINTHAWALIANDQLDQAETLLAQAKEIEPKNPRTFLNLGLLAETNQDSEAAKEAYLKAYELGKESNQYVSVANLAVGKYNAIVDKENAAINAGN